MPVSVGGRQAFIRTGRKTQTVNVCDANNQRGDYDWVIRLHDTKKFVAEHDIQVHATAEALVDWLTSQRKGKIQEQPHVEPSSEPPGSPPLPIGTDYPEDSVWLRESVFLVEQAIDQLLREFLNCPYAHRVEHSIHARLFTILTDQPHFQQWCVLRDRKFATQPVHKEWPANVPGSSTRRGNFDLAIVPPRAIAIADIRQFRAGRIDAPIAIEVGLDYDARHLQKDRDKLLRSRVSNSYLLHLTRVGRDHDRVMEIMNNPINNGEISVKTAFARINGPRRWVKFVGGQAIQEWHGL